MYARLRLLVVAANACTIGLDLILVTMRSDCPSITAPAEADAALDEALPNLE